METFSLLLLSLRLVLAGTPGSIMEMIKGEEFAKEEMQYTMVKSGQAKQTTEVLINLTMLDKNISLGTSKDVMLSSLLTFPKGDSLSNDKECCKDMMVWREVLEVNGSCKLGSNFIRGSVEVIHSVYKSPSCKCGQNPGMSCCESPELENTMCQLSTGKPFPRCQYHSVTSLKKMLTVLTGHSLMSWLVSGSKL